MITPRYRFVVPDGSGSTQLPSISISWTEGVDLRVLGAIEKQNGDPYPLISGTAAILAFKHYTQDLVPFLQFQFDVEDADAGFINLLIDRSYRSILTAKSSQVPFGVQFLDDNTGFEDAICLPGRATIIDRIGDFSVPVSVSTLQDPLSEGPPGNIFKTPMIGAFSIGDAIVFDATQTPPAGLPAYTALRNLDPSLIPFDPGLMNVRLAGLSLIDGIDGDTGQVFTGGTPLAPEVTGLDGADFGPVTFDGVTGRLRAMAAGETEYGMCDKNGFCHLRIPGPSGG